MNNILHHQVYKILKYITIQNEEVIKVFFTENDYFNSFVKSCIEVYSLNLAERKQQPCYLGYVKLLGMELEKSKNAGSLKSKEIWKMYK